IPQAGGSLKIGMLSSLSIDVLGLSTATNLPIHDVYRGLLQRDEQYKATTDIAKTYEVNEELKTITVSLDESVKWHDGTPVTALDVLFTYATYANPYYYGMWKEGIEALDGVSSLRSFKNESISGIQVDEATKKITFQLNQITTEVEDLLTAPLLPQHQLQGKTLEEITTLAEEGKIIGNGSYEIKEASAEHVAFSKVDGTKALLDEIIFMTIQEESITEKLKNKEIDILQASPQAVSDVNSSENKEWSVVEAHGLGYHYVGMNNQNPLFKDVRIRQAIDLLVNKSEYIEHVLSGYGEVALSPIPSGNWAFAEGLKESEHSVEKAKALFTEANWDMNKEISIRYIKDHPLWETSASFVEQQLTQAGLKVKLEGMSQEELAPYLFSGKPYDLFLYSWKDETDLSYLQQQWMASGIDQGYNVVGFSNATADQSLIGAHSTLNENSRKEAYVMWQKTFSEEKPVVLLARPSQLYIVSDEVKDVSMKNSRPFLHIDKWWKKQ
ncbi:MAG: ABC transporter substrate-binding protein, partial [Bacilli bacterium]